MDRFKVVFAPRADADLKSITSFIARRSSAEVAGRFGNQLIDKALTLTTLPERGRVVPEFDHPSIREIIFKTYRIIYRIQDDVIQVIRFWHAARGTPQIDTDEFSKFGP